ncbi:hypothetical protein [Polycladidibacter hongkongensis]|uniref:hypothetical protein n=1 Tax=Polycladidibacter hongkongensis TaxID=1647556 RepID=UPI0008376A99|nr:hypothetical protein [Pseudovibrio hongkongensis]
MEKRRLQRLQRLLKVQQQKENALRYEIAVLDAEINQIEEREQEYLGLWNGQEGRMRELMNQTIDRRLKSCKRDRALRTTHKDELLEQLHDTNRQTTVAERQRDKVKVAHSRKQERVALMDIAELHLANHRKG